MKRAFLEEVYAHMEWADAMVWSAVDLAPGSGEDAVVENTLVHLHLVQRVYLELWRSEAPTMRTRADFESLAAVRGWAREYHQDAREHIAGVDEGSLRRELAIPWVDLVEGQLGAPPGPVTVGESMYQVVAHSMYHRGQVNRRIRELGGEPPLVDYVVWIWRGRPEPVWP